jgi:putative transcriptional regulator
MIRTRFAELLAEKRIRDQLRWPLKSISRATGITRHSIRSWHDGKVTSFRTETVITLCRFFECEIGDLIVYVPEE